MLYIKYQTRKSFHVSPLFSVAGLTVELEFHSLLLWNTETATKTCRVLVAKLSWCELASSLAGLLSWLEASLAVRDEQCSERLVCGLSPCRGYSDVARPCSCLACMRCDWACCAAERAVAAKSDNPPTGCRTSRSLSVCHGFNQHMLLCVWKYSSHHCDAEGSCS